MGCSVLPVFGHGLFSPFGFREWAVESFRFSGMGCIGHFWGDETRHSWNLTSTRLDMDVHLLFHCYTPMDETRQGFPFRWTILKGHFHFERRFAFRSDGSSEWESILIWLISRDYFHSSLFMFLWLCLFVYVPVCVCVCVCVYVCVCVCVCRNGEMVDDSMILSISPCVRACAHACVFVSGCLCVEMVRRNGNRWGSKWFRFSIRIIAMENKNERRILNFSYPAFHSKRDLELVRFRFWFPFLNPLWLSSPQEWGVDSLNCGGLPETDSIL